MLEQFSTLHPVLQAFLAVCFTWLMTAFGAAVVFWRRDISRKVLDWMLGFAAGAMIFVVVEEVIPESQQGDHADLATMGTMLGFAVMMALDVALG